MGAENNDLDEANIPPEVLGKIRRIQERVRQLEDQNNLLKERLASSEYESAQKGEDVNRRDELLVRLQCELVEEREGLMKEKEEEIGKLKQQITDLRREGSRKSSPELLSALWASGRDYCCSGCATDAGNDDSFSELNGGRDKTREKDDDDMTFEYF